MSIKTTVEKSIKLIVVVSMLLIIIITFNSLENTISNQQDSHIEQLTEFITYEINRIVDVNTLIESYQVKNLETISNDILSYFSGRDFSDIKTDELNQVLKLHNLSGVALFKDLGDDVVIEKSTSKVEMGLSTNKWGFWYTAFRQLFDDGKVNIDKGTSKDSFWIGPRSKAYEQEGFFVFSYTKVPNQPYLLNLFIDDKKAFDATNTFDTNKVFEKLVEGSDFIDQIAIINVEAWNNRFQQENRSKLQDFTIEYGTYSAFTVEDTYYLNQACNLEVQESINLDVKVNEENKVKRYTKLTDYEVLVFVLNHDKQSALYFQIGATVISGLLSIWFLGYILMRYNNKKFTNLLEIEKERLEVAESYKQTVQILPSIVLRLSIIDEVFIVKYCEGKALKFIGVDADSIRSQQLDKFMPSDYIDHVKSQLKNMSSGESSRFEYAIGNRIFENKVEWLKSPLKIPQANFVEDEIIILWNDITELRLSEDRSRFMAYHDYLTKLPNRRYFKEKTEEAIKNSSETFYLAFIDLDGFKNVNDSDGHNIGDELLTQVANRLTKSIRSCDFVARMGGDEFAILFESTDSKDDFEKLITNIKKEVSKPYTIKNLNFTIGISIGISKFRDDGYDYGTLLKKADIAMYKVKYSGKGNHEYYNSKMEL